MSLKGKVALVTGSTSGIGLGIARAFAQQGADVMLNGFGNAAEIETLRAGMASEFGIGAAYSGADIGKPDQIAAMVATTEEKFGSLDILVNNAGTSSRPTSRISPPSAGTPSSPLTSRACSTA
jgi:3-hydroxybutyrate dehydrogenase